MSGLTALQTLDLSSNALVHCHSNESDRDLFLRSVALRSLSLAHNGCLDVPAAVWRIPQLHHLELHHNRLSTLHSERASWLRSVVTLSLESNQLRALPASLGDCEQLQSVQFQPNPLTWPPADVLAYPLDRLLRWLRQHAASMPKAMDEAALNAQAAAAAAAAAAEREAAREAAAREAIRMEAAALQERYSARVARQASRAAACSHTLELQRTALAELKTAQARLEERRRQKVVQLQTTEDAVATAAAAVADIPDRHLQVARILWVLDRLGFWTGLVGVSWRDLAGLSGFTACTQAIRSQVSTCLQVGW